ncbi:protein-glutamate methylesterase/protein-glutamine glutaminase [Anaeromyxobacter paludicola]|uniref:Protein-glutamate methylesterase/protein-glutamine glutaminase n=1 Tax=Anaeromyxobacter paludicola TaxID=2918171 RepID=A0ABN6N7F3_9BACT|nr:chemotaxis response regulator protein-glutamate methylesterase [Anaeromyxobacter paludicola]BDG09107.1 chemotaxis response regulator protein-glutamate methylesterase of group 2 operon [Anaeromyxobacter paludicola]
MSGAPPRRVLVVDDSAVVREVLSAVLRRGGHLVATAPDPVIALEKIRRDPPDAILLDVELPRMDGLSFLRLLMAERPLPVVICSGLAGPGTEVALDALEAGAVAVIEKPSLGLRDFLERSADRVLSAVSEALEARVRARPPPAAGAPEPRGAPLLRGTTQKVVAVAASTGGTEAVAALLEALPPDAPGLAVVQHMPPAFTAAFARRLAERCRVEVKEAEPGDALSPGRALIAPGNRHLLVRRGGARYFVALSDGAPVSRHRPSADVLFRSTAEAAGANAVGVILTGMGDDGAEGLLALRGAGAHTIAQDEATCVVFGMPRAAIRRGAAAEILPLGLIARHVLAHARAPGAEQRS